MKSTVGNVSPEGKAKIDLDLNMGYLVATCLARSTTSFSNLAILAAIDSAMIGKMK